MTVDNTTGYWTYALTAREKPHILYGFSYQYFLESIFVSDLSPNGAGKGSGTDVIAAINLNTAISDDVECLLMGIHVARFRVAGSISGSFSAGSNQPSYTFSYGKYLKTPIQIPVGNELSLVSKINDFWINFYLGAYEPVVKDLNYMVCQLNPGTGRMLIG